MLFSVVTCCRTFFFLFFKFQDFRSLHTWTNSIFSAVPTPLATLSPLPHCACSIGNVKGGRFGQYAIKLEIPWIYWWCARCNCTALRAFVHDIFHWCLQQLPQRPESIASTSHRRRSMSRTTKHPGIVFASSKVRQQHRQGLESQANGSGSNSKIGCRVEFPNFLSIPTSHVPQAMPNLDALILYCI